MTAILSHLRAEARRRWRAWMAVVVLISVVSGLVLGALAGARRTQTAYERLVEHTEAWDVLVNPDEGAGSALDPEEVAALPQVAELGTVDGVGAVLVHDGEPTLGAGPMSLAAGDERVLVDFARPHVVDGRLFDPRDPTHVMVDEVVADHYGIRAGDHIEIATGTIEELIEWEVAGAEGPPPLTSRDAVVTGVGVAHDGVVEDEAFAYGHVYLSHAFAEAYDLEPFFYGIAIRLAPGATAAELRDALGAMAPDEAIELKTAAAVRDTVARGTMPHTVAVLLFAAVVGVAGLVVAAQATSRQLQPLRSDAGALAAMGVDRRQLRRAGLLRAVLLVVPGVVLGTAVAVAMSPLFPLGVAERAEVDPGVDVDVAVLAPGAALIASSLLLWTFGAMRHLGRLASDRPPAAGVGVAERLATAVSSPIVTTGLRAALGPSRSGRAGPVRAALAGLSLAVAAVAATVTFGANLDHLVRTPSAYGWAWDAHVSLPSAGWETPAEELVERAAATPEFTAWSVLTVDQVELEGVRVPAVGIEYGEGGAGPTILDGRRPEAEDEVLLGGRTMDLLGVGIGDRVRADGGASFEVVGQAVFAGLGTYPGADRTELGKGALFTRDGLAAVGEGFGFSSLVIDAPDPAALDAGLDRMLADQEAAVGAEEIEVHTSPALPADVQSLSQVRATPPLIAGVLAVLGGAAFAFVLVSGVRSRRREIAVLKTLGFRSRDVAGTVAWQATATALVAGAVGLLLGTLAGRTAWTVLADALGVGDDVRIPASLALVLLGVVVGANVLAVVPGLVAARTRPAPMLRAE